MLLLNPDAELTEGTVADMVRAFDSDLSVAIVGPLTVDASGQRETTVRRFPTLITLFLYQLKLHRLAAASLRCMTTSCSISAGIRRLPSTR